MSTTTTVARDDEPIRRSLAEQLTEHRRVFADYTLALDELHAGDGDADDVMHAAACRYRVADAITEIEDALARLDAGTYGACARCGGAIEAARLEALPAASHCVRCASIR